MYSWQLIEPMTNGWYMVKLATLQSKPSARWCANFRDVSIYYWLRQPTPFCLLRSFEDETFVSWVELSPPVPGIRICVRISEGIWNFLNYYFRIGYFPNSPIGTRYGEDYVVLIPWLSHRTSRSWLASYSVPEIRRVLRLIILFSVNRVCARKSVNGRSCDPAVGS